MVQRQRALYGITYLHIVRRRCALRRRSPAFPLIPSCRFGRPLKGPVPEMEGQPRPSVKRRESEHEENMKEIGSTICRSTQFNGQMNSFSTRDFVYAACRW